MVSIKEKYNKVVVPGMLEKFGLENRMEVPKVEKVVVNVGIGKFIKDSNLVKEVSENIEKITGQKPVLTKARISIAGFKIREGLEIGIKVTLRGNRKWDFIEKLVGVALPRVRDFHGIKDSAIDQNGNLNLGIKEQLIFPEILPEQVKNIFSFQVNISTTAKDKEQGKELFRLLGFPLENNTNQ